MTWLDDILGTVFRVNGTEVVSRRTVEFAAGPNVVLSHGDDAAGEKTVITIGAALESAAAAEALESAAARTLLASAVAYYDQEDLGNTRYSAGRLVSLASRSGSWPSMQAATANAPLGQNHSGVFLDDVNRYLRAPKAQGADLSGKTTLTICGWLSLGYSGGTFEPLLSQGNNVEAGANSFLFGLFDGKPITVFKGILDTWQVSTTQVAQSWSTPVFIAMTFSAGVVNHYSGRHDQPVSLLASGGSSGVIPSAIPSISGDVFLGRFDKTSTYTADYALAGSLGGVAVFDRVLTLGELQTVAAATCPVRRIVADGNSLVQGYCDGATLANPWPFRLSTTIRGPHSQIINEGLGGSTTTQLISRFDATVQPLYYPGARSNVLCFWEGSNALWVNSCDPVSTEEEIWRYVDHAKSRGWTVIVGTVMDRSYNSTWRAAKDVLNASLKKNAPLHGVTIADLGGVQEFRDCTNATYFGADTTHLNQAGSDLAALYWDQAIGAVSL
jgi:hypothetical protein